MKKATKIIALAISLVMLLGVMCACSAGSTASLMLASNNAEQTASDIVGEWTDLDGDTLTLNSDGSADYFGEACDSYSFDGKVLEFVYEGETISYDARLFGEYLVIYYESNAYTYDRVSGNSGELEGEWASNDGNDYSFSFSEGKFVEDGVETGTYAVENEEIMFIYDDDTDGSYLFGMYDVDGDELTFCYGWALWQE